VAAVDIGKIIREEADEKRAYLAEDNKKRHCN
jgi:hypothetical protein